MQGFNDLVIVWIVMKASPCIDDACKPESIELPHEMTSRVDLITQRELRTLCQRRIKDHRVWLCDEHACWIPFFISLNTPANWIWSIFGIAHCPQGSPVQ